jgi:hypothetical protein
MADSKLYPIGTGALKSRTISGLFVEFGVIKCQRTRVTLAQLNAGFTLLPARPGVKWQILDMRMIAVGGAATTADSADIAGTRAGSAVLLFVTLVAALTRSTLVRTMAGNTSILADGASFTPLDVNTPVTVKTTGTAMTVLTNLDVFLHYMAVQG